MKLETVKSFILVILIGTSLLLSFVIWNYQESYVPLQQKYVNEVNIGGTEETKRSIIQPHSIVFHSNNKVYGFPEASERVDLYETIQDWELTNFSLVNPPNMNIPGKAVEFSFPLSIQLSMIPTLFQIEDEDHLPDWLFDRVVMIPNGQHSTLEVYFLSIDESEAARFVVTEPDSYMYIMSIFNKEHRLIPYVVFNAEHKPIYIPKESVEMKRRSLAIEPIEPTLLVNALFEIPSLVNHTIGETNYNDGQRMMDVLNDGRSMEFTNPIQSNGHIPFNDLIDLSLNHINGHKGWTNDFVLENIDGVKNRLQYKMYYGGYPIYSHEDYSMIEQQWENQDLYQYKRPLFRLTNLINSETTTLPSGEEVLEYLYDNDNFQINNITDIRLGYRLKYDERVPFSVTLDPTWYLHYNDRWLELILSSSELLSKGGL